MYLQLHPLYKSLTISGNCLQVAVRPFGEKSEQPLCWRQQSGAWYGALLALFGVQLLTGLLPVTRSIIHALTSPRPQTRYLVGTDATIFATFQWLLPSSLADEAALMLDEVMLE